MLLNYLQRPCALSSSPCLEWSPVIRVSSKFLFLAHLKHHLAHTQRLSSVMLPYSPPRPPAPGATLVFVVLQIIYLTERPAKLIPSCFIHVFIPMEVKALESCYAPSQGEGRLLYPERAAVQLEQWGAPASRAFLVSLSPLPHPPTVQSAQNNTQTKGQSWPQQTPPCLFLPWCTL